MVSAVSASSWRFAARAYARPARVTRTDLPVGRSSDTFTRVDSQLREGIQRPCGSQVQSRNSRSIGKRDVGAGVRVQFALMVSAVRQAGQEIIAFGVSIIDNAPLKSQRPL